MWKLPAARVWPRGGLVSGKAHLLRLLSLVPPPLESSLYHTRGSNCRLGSWPSLPKAPPRAPLVLICPARAPRSLSSPQIHYPRRNPCNSAARKRPKLLQCITTTFTVPIFTASLCIIGARDRTCGTPLLRAARNRARFRGRETGRGPDSYRSTLVYTGPIIMSKSIIALALICRIGHGQARHHQGQQPPRPPPPRQR